MPFGLSHLYVDENRIITIIIIIIIIIPIVHVVATESSIVRLKKLFILNAGRPPTHGAKSGQLSVHYTHLGKPFIHKVCQGQFSTHNHS